MSHALPPLYAWAVEILAGQELSRHRLKLRLIKRYHRWGQRQQTGGDQAYDAPEAIDWQSSAFGEVLDQCLDRLESENILNNQRYSEMRVRNLRARGRSRLYIRQALQTEDEIDPAIIENIWQQEEDALSSDNDDTKDNEEWQALLTTVRKRHLSSPSPEGTYDKERIWRVLSRAGFSTKLIQAYLSQAGI